MGAALLMGVRDGPPTMVKPGSTGTSSIREVDAWWWDSCIRFSTGVGMKAELTIRLAPLAFSFLLPLLFFGFLLDLEGASSLADVTFLPYFTFTPPYFLYDYLIPLVQGHMAIHAALS